MDDKRTESVPGDACLDHLLEELRELLCPVQKMADVPSLPAWPVLAIIGNPRSGTSVLLQALANSGAFAYPTNLMARFAYSPYIGARIQQMLFDASYDRHGDFQDIRSSVNFTSDLGKSRGALAVNEFQHFFRCFIPAYMPRFLSDEELMKIDFAKMSQELASIEHAFGKPFVTKAVLLQYNLITFCKKIPQLLFLYIKRDPLYVMQSIYTARERYHGSHDTWWSVQPREYDRLVKMDVAHQIAGQVFFTTQSIEHELAQMPDEKKVCIEYEDFCRDPARAYRVIVDKYVSHGVDMSTEYSGPCEFTCQNKKRLSSSHLDGFLSAYEEFERYGIDLTTSRQV